MLWGWWEWLSSFNGNDMGQIMPGLYVGTKFDAEDHVQIKANNITHILSIYEDAVPGQFQDIKYKCVNLKDGSGQNLIQYIHECVAFIHRARLNGGNVLINCVAGISRSGSICVAYVMTIGNTEMKTALRFARKGRNIIRPNTGFKTQLVLYQHSEMKMVREHMVKVFGDFRLEDLRYIDRVLNGPDEEEDKKKDENEGVEVQENVADSSL